VLVEKSRLCDPENYEKLTHVIIDYLRTRFHTEVPHISTLSPELSILKQIFSRKPTLVEIADDSGELDISALSEILDPTKLRGQSTFGVKASFKNYSEESKIKFKTAFYCRIAPKTVFRKVEVCAEIKGLKHLTVNINVYDHAGESISSYKAAHIFNAPLKVIIAVGRGEVVKKAAELISNALYRGQADIILADEKSLVSSLSTLPETPYGKKFCFYPGTRQIKAPISTYFRAVQNFLLEVTLEQKSDNDVETSFVLRYVAPVLIDAQKDAVLIVGRLGYPMYVYYADDRLDRWSIHHLMEIEGLLSWENCTSNWGWRKITKKGVEITGLYNLIPIGCLAVESEQNNHSIILRDWHIEAELIFPIQHSQRSLRESFEEAIRLVTDRVKRKGIFIDKEALRMAGFIVVSALQQAFPNLQRLYVFQEESLIEGLDALLSGQHKVIVLQARTAGGKTLAFLLPLLTWVVYTKISGKYPIGVKALLFYPTTALQNDQATSLFRILWFINEILFSIERPLISMGVLHGYTPRRYYSYGVSSRRSEELLRLTCPLCSEKLSIEWHPIPGTSNLFQEKIICNNPSCILNDPSSDSARLLQQVVKATREAVYSSPPDLLIANPDILNVRLTLAGREDPAGLSILGKSVYICERCGAPHDYLKPPKRCVSCGYRRFRRIEPSHPKVIVVDEAHLLRGAFGAQVSHTLTRIEQVIRMLNKLPSDWRPLYFISSATLNNPEDRAQELVATQRKNIKTVSAVPLRGHTPTYRVHAFIMPKVYSPEATTARIIEALYSSVSAVEPPKKGELINSLEDLRRKTFASVLPATLVFVNRIAEANELLSHIKSFLPPYVRVDGHTTDFAEDRVKVEDKFTRGELEAIIATRGLEVGVDFDRVDVGIIYGMPFYISDYTQRIGRIGRRQHCIVFNLFMPDQPIDYFYYKNWRLLCDGHLRESHMRSEAYRIDRNNVEAVKRSARRVVLDLISTQPAAQRLLKTTFSQRIRGQSLIDYLQGVFNYLSYYVQPSLMLSGDLLLEAQKIASSFAGELLRLIKLHSDLSRAIQRGVRGRIGGLHNLRSIEPEVTYSIAGADERERDLFYAFRHSLPGQIISFRGNYFVVDSVHSHTLSSHPHRLGNEVV